MTVAAIVPIGEEKCVIELCVRLCRVEMEH